MSIRTLTASAILPAILAASSIAATTARAQLINDSFTYQGTLNNNDAGAPANGPYDITFLIYNDEAGGLPITNGTVTVNNVQVTHGLFSTEVDFGVMGEIFDSNTTRWLELRVSESGAPGTTILEPRQKLTPSTLANYALRSGFAQTSGTTLQDAYDNGNTIFFQGTMGSLRLRATADQSPILNFLSESGNLKTALGYSPVSDTGFMQFYSAPSTLILSLGKDGSTGGGGFNFIASNDDGDPGIFLEGNNNGSESSRVLISGTDNLIDLNTNADGDDTVTLPASAINATEILNEVGVSETGSSASIPLTQNVTVFDTLSSVTIQAPTDGHVLLIASAELSIVHDNGTASSINLGVSTTTSGFASNLDHETRLDASLPTGQYDFTVTTHATFPASQGFNTYYFLGDLNNSAPTSASVFDQQLSAIFIPTAYGFANLNNADQTIADLPDELTPITAPMNQFDIINEQDASLKAHLARQQRELDQMRAQFKAMQQQLENIQPHD